MENSKINPPLYVSMLALVIALLFAMQKCSTEQKLHSANAAALTDTVRHFTNKLGTQTASIATLQLEKKGLNNLLLDKDAQLAALAKEFSSIKAVVKYNAPITLPTVSVAFKDSVPCVFERSDTISNKWYRFSYVANQKGFYLDSLTLPNEATVITGYKRKWFLGQQILTTDITNTNPHIKVTNITAAELIVPVPWYKKWYLYLISGLTAGAIIFN